MHSTGVFLGATAGNEVWPDSVGAHVAAGFPDNILRAIPEVVFLTWSLCELSLVPSSTRVHAHSD